MNEFYENIRSKSECSECGGKDMGITYVYEAGGIVKNQGTLLGMKSYTGVGNLLLIACRKCGFVAKSFLIGR
ncbi:MAG: hypothetical protein JNM27_18540 [Leptospirales bacterium]|nr:hypothetical protein [Leptospirales bacterium]